MIALGLVGAALILAAVLLAVGITHLAQTTRGAALVAVVALIIALWGVVLLRYAIHH